MIMISYGERWSVDWGPSSLWVQSLCFQWLGLEIRSLGGWAGVRHPSLQQGHRAFQWRALVRTTGALEATLRGQLICLRTNTWPVRWDESRSSQLMALRIRCLTSPPPRLTLPPSVWLWPSDFWGWIITEGRWPAVRCREIEPEMGLGCFLRTVSLSFGRGRKTVLAPCLAGHGQAHIPVGQAPQ